MVKNKSRLSNSSARRLLHCSHPGMDASLLHQWESTVRRLQWLVRETAQNTYQILYSGTRGANIVKSSKVASQRCNSTFVQCRLISACFEASCSSDGCTPVVTGNKNSGRSCQRT